MMKVNRAMLYKEKESISFFLGDGDTIERDFIDRLRKRPFMLELVDKSVTILRIFNNANYICTLVYEGDYPLLEINVYESIAIDDHDDPIWINYLAPATKSLVVKWLSSEEGRKIFEERGRQKDIENLCTEIRARIKQQYAHHIDGIEDYLALDSQEQHLPSGFIDERCFHRRDFAEVMEDPTIKPNDILDSFEFFANIMKYHIDEFTGALGSEYMKKQASKVKFTDTEFKAKLTEWLGGNLNDTKEEAFNVQTGQPCFTSTQMGIFLTAVGRLTEKNNQPGKTTLGDVVQRIAGYKSTANCQNMKRISESDKKIVADVLRSQFPNLANEVMKIY